MKPNHFNSMTNEQAALLKVLYRQPGSVDMEDILSVHDSMDFYADSSALKSPRDVVIMDDEFLVSLEKNRRNVSGRLRYAYLSDADAAVRGMDLTVVARLRRIMDKVVQIYCDAGGNASRLKKAILNGSGNSRKNYVSFPDEGQQEYGNNYRLVRWGTGTGLLGITAADFIGSISDVLKQLQGLFAHDAEAEAAFQLDKNVVDYFHLLSDQFSSRPSSSGQDKQIRTTANAPSTLHGAAQSESKQSSPNGANHSSGKDTPMEKADKGFIDRAIDWIAANPGMSILIAAALVGGGILIKRALERTPAASEVDRVAFKRKRNHEKSSRKKVRSGELV